MKVKLKKSIIMIMCLFFFNIISQQCVSAKENNEINSDTVAEFTNKYLKENMDKYDIPGASVAIIKDGKEIFKGGYGFSDVENNVLVDPDETTFPLASVSKLFTATSIMQLYENEKIDLNADADNYIKPFSIQNPYSIPVTCSNLLTHSSGVDEESELNVGTFNENDIKSQDYFLSKHSPKVVRQPNLVSRYSNEGYNILGYIVENVSKETYPEYVQKNIFDVLGMKNSYIRYKNDTMAKGYAYDDGKYILQDLAYQYNLGSSGIITTATDMEKFMQAHLNNGQLNGQSILKPETESLMHDKEFSNNDDLPGMGYGFIRSERNNKLILKHEGALPGYTTSLFLIPEDNLGVFISTNTLNAMPFNFEDAFLDHFYPSDENKFSEVSPKTNKDYSDYAGVYRSYDGYGKSNLMKLGFLFAPDIDMTITDNKDGTLTLEEYTSAKENVTTKLIECGDNLFAREDGKGDFAFRIDNGKVTYAFNDVSHNSFEKLSFYENRTLHLSILLIGVLIFILNIIISLFKYIRKSIKKISKNSAVFDKLNLTNTVTGILNLIGFLGSLLLAQIMVAQYSSKYIPLLYFTLILLILGAILSFIQLILFVIVALKNKGYRKKKIYLLIMNIINILFIFSTYYSNILGLKIY